jgi:NAD-specific glutamate dehydrogenase
MKLVGVNPTEPQSSLINSLQDYLINKNDPNLEERLEISKGIFRRLPNYVAQESDLKTLETITNHAFELLKKISTSNENILSNNFKLNSEHNHVQGYLIAITDRPFIVDTISEFLRENEVEVSCFTHPLFQLETRGQISLTYFQIDESNNPSGAMEIL